jgi:hypothetical protein
MRAQGEAPEVPPSGLRLISDGNDRDNAVMQGDVVPDVIVAEINTEHRLARASASTAVQHAIRCGSTPGRAEGDAQAW